MLSLTVEFTVAAHDTTGGMVTKISEAASIAKLGIDVYIVKVRLPTIFCHNLRHFKNMCALKIFSLDAGSIRTFSKSLKRRIERQHSRRLARNCHPVHEIAGKAVRISRGGQTPEVQIPYNILLILFSKFFGLGWKVTWPLMNTLLPLTDTKSVALDNSICWH